MTTQNKPIENLITFYGPPFTGKSTLMLAIAKELVKKGSSVGIIDGNLRYPSIRGILDFPENPRISLSEAIESLTPFNDKDCFIPLADSGLCILSLRPKHLASRLFETGETQTVNLLQNASRAFDFLFLDSEDSISNPFSLIGLKMAGKVLLAISPTRRCRIWLESYEPLLKALTKDPLKVSICLTPVPEISTDSFGKITELPYVPDIPIYSAHGELPYTMGGRSAKNYNAAVLALAERILYV